MLRIQRGTRPNSFFYYVGDGFHYHLSYVLNLPKGQTAYFKCVKYEQGCRGRAVYDRRRGFRRTRLHRNHARDIDYPTVMQWRQRILRRCRKLEYVSLRRIVVEESRGFPVAVKRRSRLGMLRSAMQRVRHAMYPLPPDTLEGLTNILQDPVYRLITATRDCADNLYAASVTAADQSHHIILMSRRMAAIAGRLDVLFGDGTFKTLPAIRELDEASQVYVLVGHWNHTIIPLAWIIMQRRTYHAYSAVLRVLRRLLKGGAFRRLITDFEPAIRRPASEVFPGITLQGCFFHLVRAFLRHAIERLGMARLIRIHPYKRLMKLCCSLPLLPYREISQGFRLIVEDARQAGRQVYRRMRPFLGYVLRRGVGHPVRKRWMCVYGSLHRTNNTCESHNRVLRDAIGTAHPNIYHFIFSLAAIEEDAFANADALAHGERANRRRKASSIMLDQRLRNLARGMEHPVDNQNAAIMRFLEVAAHSFDTAYDRVVEME